MMKIKFFSDYNRDSADLLNRFRANYDVYDDELGFTTGDDYDFAVAFNRSDVPIRKGAKMITIIQEPSFSEAHQFRTSLTNSDYLIVHDAELFKMTWDVEFRGMVIESPSFMFYDDHVHHTFFDNTAEVNKTKKLSMIVSGLCFSRGNYRKRLNLLSKILNSDLDIDIYGRGLHISDPRYKGPLEYKYAGLLPYEYSIAIENSNEKNYISEKFVDCVLCNTVPIYNGAPNVSKVYDDRYFREIDLNSDTIVKDIASIIAEPAPGTILNKEIYRNQLNLYTKLKQIIFEIDPLTPSLF